MRNSYQVHFSQRSRQIPVGLVEGIVRVLDPRSRTIGRAVMLAAGISRTPHPSVLMLSSKPEHITEKNVI